MLGNIGSNFIPKKSGNLTGKEALAERWILAKLTSTARDVNQALTDREFSRATQKLYQYWYDCLCDVYIVRSASIHSAPYAMLIAI